MRFTLALVASLAAFSSAIDLDTKAETIIDTETKTDTIIDAETKAEVIIDTETKAEAKSDFTPVLMEELGAPLANGAVSAGQNDDKSAADTNASSDSATTINADDSAMFTINEQEAGPEVQAPGASFHGQPPQQKPKPKDAKQPYDAYF